MLQLTLVRWLISFPVKTAEDLWPRSRIKKKSICPNIRFPSPTSFTQLFTIRLYTVVIYGGAVVVFAATVVAI